MHLGEVLQHLAGVRWSWFLAAIVVATATFPLRVVRWRYLLRLEGAPIPWAPLWHAVAVGFMANNVLPARAGEVARPLMVRHLTGVRFTTAFASVAVERVLDGITLVALLLVATAVGGFNPETRVGNATIGGIATASAVLFGAALLVALAVVRWPQPMLRVAKGIFGAVLPRRFADRASEAATGLVDGLDALAAPGRALYAFLWSGVLWVTGAASFWLACRAFAIDVPWSAGLMLQALMGFGVAVPSAPGFAGVFEAVIKATLVLYGVAEVPAVSMAIGFHVGSWLPITALGFWSLARAGLHMRDLRRNAEGDS